MNKKILIPVITATAFVAISGYSLTQANTQETSSLSPMLQKLAEKFRLNKNDVSNFVTEQRTVMQQERQKLIEEKLSNFVKNGKLTEKQKNELLALINKHRTQMQDLRNKSKEERQKLMKERQAERETRRAELETWAKNNNINLQDLDLGLGEGKGNGRMGKGMMLN